MKVSLEAHKMIHPAPNVGIKACKLGNGVSLLNLKMAYVIRKNPSKLTD
jgi:hypothetical protein